MPAVTQSCHRGRMKAEMWCWRARLTSREGIRPVRAASPALPARCPAQQPAPGCPLPLGPAHPSPPAPPGCLGSPSGKADPGREGARPGTGGGPAAAPAGACSPLGAAPRSPGPCSPSRRKAALPSVRERGGDGAPKSGICTLTSAPRAPQPPPGRALAPPGRGGPGAPQLQREGKGGGRPAAPRSPAPGPPGRRRGSGSGGRGLLDGAGAVTGLGR